MAQAVSMPMCPMAETCKGIMEKPLSGLLMVIPGTAFMALGAVVIAWPSVLPWLVAAACILVGAAMLLMANFMRRLGARLRRAGG